MARKRLSPARLDVFSAELAPQPARAPIARVASDSAATAALEELSARMQAARDQGRMVLDLALEAVEAGHLLRDRLGAEPEALEALKRSIAARGQQSPIEVVALDAGRYGLISGWRRLLALAQLQAETGEPRFGRVLALLRQPADQAEAYRAMVEENEIRADLSFYERARIVLRAVEAQVFDSEKSALQGLYPNVSYARRSKIKSFIPLVAALDGALNHPARISERLGLALSRLLAAPGAADRLRADLLRAQPASAEAELRLLTQALDPRRPAPDPSLTGPSDTESRGRDRGGDGASGGPDIAVEIEAGRIILTGPGLTPEFAERLKRWLAPG